MEQNIEVYGDGRIVVEHRAGHEFVFQAVHSQELVLHLTNVRWFETAAARSRLHHLDEARLLARQAAENEGWL